MDTPKITDGEYNVMNVLWTHGPMTATDIVKRLSAEVGWKRNTTYTFIRRLVARNIVRRDEPNFLCTPLYTREQAAASETRSFMNKMFEGSLRTMVASFLDGDVSQKEIDEVKQMIAEWEAGHGR